MSIRTLALLCAALTLSVGLIACGGSGGDSNALSEKDYFKEVNAAQTKFATQAGKLNLANPSSPDAFQSSLDKLSPLIDDLTAELDKIKPPEKVTSEHDKLVTTMKEYGDTIDKQKGELDSGDQGTVRNSAQAIATASTKFSKDFDATITAINQKLN